MILVLSPDCPKSQLDEIVRLSEGLGWLASVSRGSEQIVVALDGSGDPAALQAAFERRNDIDVLPILSREDYKHALSRRRLIGGLVSGLGALTAVAVGMPVIGFLLPPRGTLADRDLVRAAGRGELDEHDAKRVRLLGKPVLLVRGEKDRYYALSAICTHMDICELEWSRERRELVCPCHGGAFDVYGNVTHGPPSIPLRSYEVDQLGDDLFIRRDT